ncbi:MAG: phage late control D family protein, partial [Caulobacteraceae bacterium]
PQGLVLVNGVQAPCLDWEVTTCGFFQASTFRVTLAASGLPAGLSLAALCDMSAVPVEVRASLDGGAPTSLILGRADDVDVDWAARTVSLSGRDRTADLIEARTAESFLNRTASQAVETLAARHGLTANAAATPTKIGAYSQSDHAKLSGQGSEWDLVVHLAKKEGFYAWVSGTTLNFQPETAAVGAPTVVRWTPAGGGALAAGPFVGLKTRRNLSLASAVTVTVSSWNHTQKTPFKATVTGVKTGAPGGSPQTYSYRKPGLTFDQARQLAQSQLEAVTRHERTLELEMAPDLTLTPRGQIELAGTGTAFDQLYWIDQVERRMAFGEFSQTVSAKNHSPQDAEG